MKTGNNYILEIVEADDFAVLENGDLYFYDIQDEVIMIYVAGVWASVGVIVD